MSILGSIGIGDKVILKQKIDNLKNNNILDEERMQAENDYAYYKYDMSIACTINNKYIYTYNVRILSTNPIFKAFSEQYKKSKKQSQFGSDNEMFREFFQQYLGLDMVIVSNLTQNVDYVGPF